MLALTSDNCRREMLVAAQPMQLSPPPAPAAIMLGHPGQIGFYNACISAAATQRSEVQVSLEDSADPDMHCAADLHVAFHYLGAERLETERPSRAAPSNKLSRKKQLDRPGLWVPSEPGISADVVLALPYLALQSKGVLLTLLDPKGESRKDQGRLNRF